MQLPKTVRNKPTSEASYYELYIRAYSVLRALHSTVPRDTFEIGVAVRALRYIEHEASHRFFGLQNPVDCALESLEASPKRNRTMPTSLQHRLMKAAWEKRQYKVCPRCKRTVRVHRIVVGVCTDCRDIDKADLLERWATSKLREGEYLMPVETLTDRDGNVMACQDERYEIVADADASGYYRVQLEDSEEYIKPIVTSPLDPPVWLPATDEYVVIHSELLGHYNYRVIHNKFWEISF